MYSFLNSSDNCDGHSGLGNTHLPRACFIEKVTKPRELSGLVSVIIVGEVSNKKLLWNRKEGWGSEGGRRTIKCYLWETEEREEREWC